MSLRSSLLGFVVLLSGAVCPAFAGPIAPTEPLLRYGGRFDSTDPAAPLCTWTGSSIALTVSGGSIQVTLHDELGRNYWQVIINGQPTSVLALQAGEHTYQVASNLPPGRHRVELFKRTEASQGYTRFKGFVIDDTAVLHPTPPRPRRIEAVGDSITVGYGNEGSSSDGFQPSQQNGWMTYTAIAARAANADYMCIAWSGRKMWPGTSITPIYDRVAPNATTTTWDFSRFIADLVVINLGTNDFMDSNPDETSWVNAYVNFIGRLRTNYPNAVVYCAVGPHITDSPSTRKPRTTLLGYLAKVVERTNTEGSPLVRIVDLGTHQPREYGANGHPTVATHIRMSDILIAAMKEDLGEEFFRYTYSVAPYGDDGAVGSSDAPWQTLAHAVENVRPGDTVQLHNGNYTGPVVLSRSGADGAPITFEAAAGHAPIINGGGATASPGLSPLLWLRDVSHVTLRGLVLAHYGSFQSGATPVGILVSGGGADVHLVNNRIVNVGSQPPANPARGIAVLGDSATPRTGTVLTRNHLHQLSLNAGDALRLEGNIDGFRIEQSLIRDTTGGGITLHGHTGISPSPSQDFPRRGVISANSLSDHASHGIRIDGAEDVLVERNYIRRGFVGVEIGASLAARASARVELRNNLIAANSGAGLALGGPDASAGFATDCVVEHNTFFQNNVFNTGAGEILLRHDVRDSDFRHNLIVTGAPNLVVANPFTQNTGNTFDRNLVHAPGTPAWQWMNTTHTGLAAWTAATGHDAHTLVADPRLVDPSRGDYSLRPGSPAIDAGSPASGVGADELDLPGDPRVHGAAADIGAYEFNLLRFATGSVNASPTITLTPSEARVSLPRRADWSAQGISFRLQAKEDLNAPWTDVAAVLEDSAPGWAGGVITLRVARPTSSKWFARVLISPDPATP